MSEKKILSKKARKAAKRLFKKQPHSTRPFEAKDYKALPVGETITQ
jgi:hypothetical protein